MDVGSDSSRCELDSVTSAESLQMITDEFRLHHLTSPDVTSADLSKRVAALELDNERLQVDLENARIELNAKNAANQGLKNKIAELYIEAQKSLQEKQKFNNSMKDTQCRLVTAENSMKWYQGQMHEVQANKKTLQTEIDTYQSMLRQKHQTLVNVTAKWKQLNEDYAIAIQKHRKEKDTLQAEIELLKMKDNNSFKWPQLQLQLQQQQLVSPSSPSMAHEELSIRLESAEEELADARAELRALEQRLCSAEVDKSSLESSLGKQRTLLVATENGFRNCQAERAELADVARELRIELQKLRTENETLQMSLLEARQEREQVEDAIEQLRSQLTKMIAQHKLLKSRNVELEDKLNNMQDVLNENKRLKSLSYSANASLFRRLRQERRKSSNLQKQLCQEQSKNRLLNDELSDPLKSSKVSEESLDEGYADSSSLLTIGPSPPSSLPSPRLLNPVLLDTINDVLTRSKNFWEPVQIGLDELHAKLERCKGEKIQPWPAGVVLTPPISPLSHTRSLA